MKLMTVAAVLVNCLLLVSLPTNGVTSIVPARTLDALSDAGRFLITSTPDAGAPMPGSGGTNATNATNTTGTAAGGGGDGDYKVLYESVLAVLLLEHGILFLQYLASAVVPDEPSHIKDDEFKEASGPRGPHAASRCHGPALPQRQGA
jgi:hypothetical protein